MEIIVQNKKKTLLNKDIGEYISLTDIAKYRNEDEPFSVINNWMCSLSTIEFIGLWEKFNNPDFKPIEFDRFKNEAGNNYFVLSPQKWIASTNAIGIISKYGRYGGTFAHTDIAFKFAFWKRSLIMDFGVIVLMATEKIVCIIQNAGESAKFIIVLATIRLIICW